MSEKELAKQIIQLVGGKENISSVQHCATRLRIIVHDKEKIKVDDIENLESVKGSFFNAGQYQIILGTGLVNRVYDATMSELGKAAEVSAPVKTKKTKRLHTEISSRELSECFPMFLFRLFLFWLLQVCSWACVVCSLRKRFSVFSD